MSSNGLSLNLPEDLPEKDWLDIGAQLDRASSQLHWLIGDWWNFGERKYGERKAITERDDWTGRPAFQTCMNDAWVCRKFETSRRREVLVWSFQHHAEVAALPAEKADELLDWCVEGMEDRGRRRSSRELRLKVAEYKQKADERLNARRAAEHEERWGQWNEDNRRRSASVIRIAGPENYPPQTPRKIVIITGGGQPAPEEPEPEPALDDSVANGTVPPQLAVLREEPPVIDRVEIARAALRRLPPDERVEVLADAAAEIGYRLEPL